MHAQLVPNCIGSLVACAMRTNGGGWEVAHSARYAKCSNILWCDHTHSKGEKLWIEDREMEMFLWPTNCFSG